MNNILALLNSMSMMASATPPSRPPQASSEGPSSAAWLTLGAGICSWLFLPLIAAVVGILAGKAELKAIEEGKSPQAGETITKIGYYVSLANIIITVVSGCLSIALIVAIWGGLLAGVSGLAIFTEIANSMQ